MIALGARRIIIQSDFHQPTRFRSTSSVKETCSSDPANGSSIPKDRPVSSPDWQIADAHERVSWQPRYRDSIPRNHVDPRSHPVCFENPSRLSPCPLSCYRMNCLPTNFLRRFKADRFRPAIRGMRSLCMVIRNWFKREREGGGREQENRKRTKDEKFAGRRVKKRKKEREHETCSERSAILSRSKVYIGPLFSAVF